MFACCNVEAEPPKRFGYPPKYLWEGLKTETEDILAGCGSREYRNGELRFDPEEPGDMPDLSEANNSLAVVLQENEYLWDELKSEKTENGVLFGKCVKVGVDVRKTQCRTVGVIAGDEECYDKFANLFDAVIKDFQDIQVDRQQIFQSDWNLGKLAPIDDENGLVQSIRVRVARNLKGFAFPGSIDFDDRRLVEEALSTILMDIPGVYHGLADSRSYHDPMSRKFHKQLKSSKASFKLLRDPKSLVNGYCRQWPDARGIWSNFQNNVHAHINEEDHLRIFSTENSGNLTAVFNRVGTVLNALDVEFAFNENIGYLTSCPGSVGTGLHCSALLKIQNLKNLAEFPELCKHLNLIANKKANWTNCSLMTEDVVMVCNRQTIGQTEVQIATDFHTAVTRLTHLEMKLIAGENVQDGITRVLEDRPETDATTCIIF